MLKTSRTSYYNSLVTNRAMDKVIENGLTVRKIYEYGNRINSLEESRLSNHLGINGIIESSDNKFIFVKRFDNVSIGKNTLGCSVAASLKTKYALNDAGKFTAKGLKKSILEEVNAELFINEGVNIELNSNLIAFYRDLVEGGKPQILFYIKCSMSSHEINENFKNNIRKSTEEKKKLQRDGSKLLFLEPARIKLRVDRLIYCNPKGAPKKQYPILPPTSASVVILMRYLEERSKSQK